MRNMLKRSGAVFALVGIVSVAPVMAQAPPPRQPGQAEKPKDPGPATGEFITLDDQAKTFSIRTEAGIEMKFSYTEKTEVVGAMKDLSDLAKMNGPRLTVTYGSHGTAHTATRIEVMPKS
jgi:hypothetical protein